jgi:hypothetical protein
MIMLGRWPGDHGRRQRSILPPKSQPLHARMPVTNTSSCENISNAILFPGNFPTSADHDQPCPVLCHSSLTTLSTASHTHTIPATPLPGLVTCVGYQQHTAGHSDVPLTVDHTAPHSVWGRVWSLGSGGSDVTAATGLPSHVSNYLSSDARSFSSTSEEGGLMLV